MAVFLCQMGEVLCFRSASFLAVDHLLVYLTLCHRLFVGLPGIIMVFKLSFTCWMIFVCRFAGCLQWRENYGCPLFDFQPSSHSTGTP